MKLLQRRAILFRRLADNTDNPKRDLLGRMAEADNAMDVAAIILAYYSRFGMIYNSATKGMQQPLLHDGWKIARVAIEEHKRRHPEHAGDVSPLYNMPPETNKAHRDWAKLHAKQGRDGKQLRFERPKKAQPYAVKVD